PLVVRLNRFTRRIALVVLIAIVLLAVGQYLQGDPLIEIFFLAVALAVSAIPAGLPIAITVALSIATNRMARRNVIVRQLPAVEGLGSCTLIASDKTGTLTANVLTVRRLWLPQDGELAVSGEGYQPQGEITRDGRPVEDKTRERLRELALTGALCNEGELRQEEGQFKPQGDAVDVALLVLARKLELEPAELAGQYPKLGEIPFESQRRFAAIFHDSDQGAMARVKGATETLLPMCEGVDRQSVERQLDRLAQGGYRVLALAGGPVERQGAEQADPQTLRGLRFLGLVGFIDPLRQGVKEAVEKCHRAGVDVRMITGDHPATGLAIARQLGIEDDPQQVITGQEMREIQQRDLALKEEVRHPRVFARVEPTQKTDLVKSLQRAGHTVAVTGDGVNDAPALKAADIGVAMGKSGTDVARNAADLILTDDNFASIVNGIEEGRIAYDNIRKVTWLLVSTGAAEVVLFFLAFLTGLPLPLTPVQLLWLNLITNGIQDKALAFEKGEPGALNRPPRPPNEPIFERVMIQETVVSGLWMGVVAFAFFYFLYREQGMSEFDARNGLLLLMVLFENIHALNCRSEHRSIFQVPLSANWLLIGAVVLAQGIHIGAMYIPWLSQVLEVQPVPLEAWAFLLGLALTLAVVVEIFKFIRRSRPAGKPQEKPQTGRKAPRKRTLG
ncbi:MAG: HAD-IC family P-type ATPase, partial [Candidatus Competibacteraceae bacterium]|nr:HAD-IC family P-type ATPase [Candidatus Competibacteraceae bacterium]